jgi:hypothetical protein
MDQGSIDQPAGQQAFQAPPVATVEQQAPGSSAAPSKPDTNQPETDEPKTLGPAPGPVRPID